ncbi:hypothetical protein [Clostridium sp.]|uniref:hypothetical protein n=1 Tax=Clostridium sp. TaxID=1506 RepID=UPI003217F00F
MKFRKITAIALAIGVLTIGGTTAFAAQQNSSDKVQTTTSNSASINTDKAGNVVDDKGNIVITKDKLNDSANSSGQISSTADPTGKIDDSNLSPQDKTAVDALRAETAKQTPYK